MAIISVKQGKAVKSFKPKNYVDFWSDHVSYKEEDSGLGSTMLKAIKLKGYQNAIANFVKILTNKDIPVVYNGSDSYTDGERVVLAGDLNDKKFDVAAGLALHEASHIKHTDWAPLKELRNMQHDEASMISAGYSRPFSMAVNQIKGLLNWIEDRRIDSKVFKSSPGYKGYYHSMYDHYFRSKEVTMMLGSKEYADVKYSNYEAHLINMMNPNFKANALPGLQEIVNLIDVNNIDRLTSTADALELAKQVHLLILAQLKNELEKEEEEKEEEKEQEGGQGNQEEEQEDDESSEEEGEGEGDGGGAEGAGRPELSLREEQKVKDKLKEIKQMIGGDVEKKQLKNKQAQMVEVVTKSGVDVAATVNGRFECMVYRLDQRSTLLDNFYNAVEAYHNVEYGTKDYSELQRKYRSAACKAANFLPPAYKHNISSNPKNQFDNWITPGVQLGAMLGRKLLVRRESRSLEHNRLRSGKIDAKRIAHAGYGVESIFNQINVESNRNAVIHLTLDASGSMCGERWNNSTKMAAALIKAISMVDGLELQISARDTAGYGRSYQPVISVLYDSTINKPMQGLRALSVTRANGLTPEGICYEALIDKKILKPSTTETDSFLINICDGDPYFDDSKGNYYQGDEAVNHTRKQVKRMNNDLGIKHAGFFLGDENYGAYERFKRMYGAKQTQAIKEANNAMIIAQHINKQLMS